MISKYYLLFLNSMSVYGEIENCCSDCVDVEVFMVYWGFLAEDFYFYDALVPFAFV